MAQQEALNSLTINNTIGSFTLTKLWIEKAEELNLSATAVSVMTALLWHFNPKKKYVYPHQETIAKRVKRSVATVKRAISELKRAGYIVSSRTRNGNLYAFTKKFFDLFEPSESQACTEPTAKNELCMNHEHVKEQGNNNLAVVVSLKDFSKGVEGETTKEASSTTVSVSSETHYNLSVIPEILKKKAEKGNIRNLNGYWRSLRPAIKIEYIELDKQEREKENKRIEAEKAENQRKEKERAEREANKNAPPFWEAFNRVEAIEHLKCLKGIPALLNKGYRKELRMKFNIDLSELS